MSRHFEKRADSRVPVAISMLAGVLTLLGAHQAFGRLGLAQGQPVQMASALVTSPTR
jgi:hypothetical protein